MEQDTNISNNNDNLNNENINNNHPVFQELNPILNNDDNGNHRHHENDDPNGIHMIHANWERLQQERRLLQDLDGWLELNGLRDGRSTNVNTVNEIEEHERVRNEQQYIESIHEQIFYKEIQQEQLEWQQKVMFLSTLSDQTMSITTASGTTERINRTYSFNTIETNDFDKRKVESKESNVGEVIIQNIPIDMMVNACDTIYRMVQHQRTFVQTTEDDKRNDHCSHRHSSLFVRTSSTTNDMSSSSNSSFHLSLESFSNESVLEFINLCRIVHELDTNNTNNSHSNDEVDKNNSDDGEHEKGNVSDRKATARSKEIACRTTSVTVNSSVSNNKNDMNQITEALIDAINKISDDTIVLDCCRIGHYLMAQNIVDAITTVLIKSIDTNNCYLLYQFATQYNLSSTLVERSLYHMMDTIGECTSDNHDNVDDDDDDKHYIELQKRLLVMKRAMETSLHSGGGGNSTNGSGCTKRRLYFTSIDEYLAIFAERVQYYQERLIQAKENIQHQLSDQERYSQSYTRRNMVSKSYLDMVRKIKKQEERVRTLQIAYKEQKALFRSNSSSSTGMQ